MTEPRICTCPDKEKYCKEVCACCYEEMLEDLQKLQSRNVSRRFMMRNLFDLGFEYWKVQLDQGHYERADGDALCQRCGLKFVEHPEIRGWPTFVVTCEGRIWKL